MNLSSTIAEKTRVTRQIFAVGTHYLTLKSQLESEFEWLWEAYHSDITLMSEYRFHPPRLWRFDYAQIETKVGIEIQGGIYVQGRHNQGAALEKEYEKLNAANLEGWHIFLLSASMVHVGNIDLIAAFIQRKLNEIN